MKAVKTTKQTARGSLPAAKRKIRMNEHRQKDFQSKLADIYSFHRNNVARFINGNLSVDAIFGINAEIYKLAMKAAAWEADQVAIRREERRRSRSRA